MFTIKEVAKKLNVTPQAVYKKINNEVDNEFKDCLKEVERDGRKVKAVNRKGIEILKKHFKQQFKQRNSQVENEFKSEINGEIVELLQDTISTLKEQLDTKDKQIQQLKEDYKDQLETKDKQIQELREDYKEQLQSKDRQIENNQVLLGREQQKALPGASVLDKIKNVFKRED